MQVEERGLSKVTLELGLQPMRQCLHYKLSTLCGVFLQLRRPRYPEMTGFFQFIFEPLNIIYHGITETNLLLICDVKFPSFVSKTSQALTVAFASPVGL